MLILFSLTRGTLDPGGSLKMPASLTSRPDDPDSKYDSSDRVDSGGNGINGLSCIVPRYRLVFQALESRLLHSSPNWDITVLPQNLWRRRTALRPSSNGRMDNFSLARTHYMVSV